MDQAEGGGGSQRPPEQVIYEHGREGGEKWEPDRTTELEGRSKGRGGTLSDWVNIEKSSPGYLLVTNHSKLIGGCHKEGKPQKGKA